MAEYIDKKQAIDRIASCYCMDCEHSNGILCRACEHQDDMDLIDDMPAADVQSVDRWISVEDRLPEEIGYYLVVIGNEMLVSIDIAEYSENHWHKHDKVLYWQPLPDYPDATKG